jgi:YfiH family protein
MDEPLTKKNESLLTIEKGVWKKIMAGFSTRSGGVSEKPFDTLNLGLHVDDKAKHVLENRRIFSEKIDLPLSQWVCAEQVHDNKVVKVTERDASKGAFSLSTAIAGVDGIYTRSKEVALTSLYADCVPLYFFAPKHGLIGLAHAGWKGTVGNIAKKMIDEWSLKENVPADGVHVMIGPSICDRCYEVDARVIDEVDRLWQHVLEEHLSYKNVGSGHFLLNLKALNERLLLQEGIRKENILISNYCTSCHPHLFFSHRKELGQTGRMIAFLSLKN